MTSDPVQVSAHAGQPVRIETRSMDAYRDAAATKADYVELDIRRTADAKLVAFHAARTSHGRLVSTLEYAQLCDLAEYEVPKVADVLATIKGRAKGHLDLKETGHERQLVRLALDILGPGEFIITSADDASVAAIRSRFRDGAAVPVALSLGSGPEGASDLARMRTRLSELRPVPRLRACGADWVALDHRLALSGAARRCRQTGLKIMVWTVNSEREIRYWLFRQRVDVLVTDRPALAVALRDHGFA